MFFDPFLTDFIHTVRTAEPNAFLAGGCVRDVELKNAYKDIDVIIPCANREDFNKKCSELLYPLFPNTPWTNNPDYLSRKKIKDGETTLLRSMNTKIFGISVDFLGYFCDQEWSEDMFADKVLDKFNFGVNKIAFNGKSIKKHPHFTEDVSSKKVTVHNLTSLTDLPKTIMKINSLQMKYGYTPDFSKVLKLA